MATESLNDMKKLILALTLLLIGVQAKAAPFPVFTGSIFDYITNSFPGTIRFVFSNEVRITVVRPNGHITLHSNVFMPLLNSNASPVNFVGQLADGEVVKVAVPTGGGGGNIGYLQHGGTNEVDGGGSGGNFRQIWRPGSTTSGRFTNAMEGMGTQLASQDRFHLWWGQISGVVDWGIGMWDEDEEIMKLSITETNTAKKIDIWKPLRLNNTASNNTHVNMLGQLAGGEVIQVPIPTGGGSFSSSTLSTNDPDLVLGGIAVEDFSLYSETNSLTANLGTGWRSNGLVTAAHQIVPRVFRDGITRNVLQFNGRGEYVRPLPFDTNWQRFKVIIVFAVTNMGGNQTNSLAFGIGAGTNSGYYQVGNSNFLGVGNDNSHTLYHSNSLVTPYFGLFTTRGIHRTNTVASVGNAMSGSMGDAIAALPSFSFMMLEFTRADYVTNESITVSANMPNRAAPPDTSSNTILDSIPGLGQAMFEIRAESTSGYTVVDTGTSTFGPHNSKERSLGKLNTLCLSWGYSSNLLEIAAIVVRKIK